MPLIYNVQTIYECAALLYSFLIACSALLTHVGSTNAALWTSLL